MSFALSVRPVFDPEALHDVARSAVGLSFDDMVEAVGAGLAARWPGHIETRTEWLYNMTAGTLGSMTIFHASLSEYVLLFGSSIGTQGFSGRYRMDVWDFMLAGDMWCQNEDAMGERVVFKPGDAAYLQAGTSKGYKLPDGAWMLEYARGVIPAALPVGLAHGLLSCMDLRSVARTIAVYGRLTVRELLQGKI